LAREELGAEPLTSADEPRHVPQHYASKLDSCACYPRLSGNVANVMTPRVARVLNFDEVPIKSARIDWFQDIGPDNDPIASECRFENRLGWDMREELVRRD
jgi:hypothetical protein